MPSKEKILMRKIKKREKNKLALLQKLTKIVSSERPETVPQEVVQSEGSCEDNDGLPPHITTKKKKKKSSEEVEPLKDESVNSENESESRSNEVASKTNADPTKIPGYVVPADRSFTVLEGKISDLTLRAIKEMGFTKMTDVQAHTIPLVLADHSVMVKAKTGSGKTLAFLIPIVDLVYKLGFKPRNGTAAIILTPTRELAVQTYGVLTGLMKYHKQTYGMVMGGANRSSEERKLYNGVNILVATPGRLLDHLKNTEDFIFKCAVHLVIDEVDRMLEMGFEDEIKQIIEWLPRYRLTMMFSATWSKKAEALAAETFISEYVYLGVNDPKNLLPTVNLEYQTFALVPSENRLRYLYTFLLCYIKRKIIVFFSTCMSVKYHAELFNYIDLPVMAIHGKQDQATRTRTLFQFCNADVGILFCTDIAARGLDIPGIEWVVQFDPPADPKEYIHRVGRTSRGLGPSGKAIILLRPEEFSFLVHLKRMNILLKEMMYVMGEVLDIQEPLERLLSRNYVLKDSAREAFQSYLRAYQSHNLKETFNFDTLDLKKVAKCFGLKKPPYVKLNPKKKNVAKNKAYRHTANTNR